MDEQTISFYERRTSTRNRLLDIQSLNARTVEWKNGTKIDTIVQIAVHTQSFAGTVYIYIESIE